MFTSKDDRNNTFFALMNKTSLLLLDKIFFCLEVTGYSGFKAAELNLYFIHITVCVRTSYLVLEVTVRALCPKKYGNFIGNIVYTLLKRY